MTRLVRLADVPPRPWRNGGGTTHELLATPPGDDGWRVRISIARIAADGPFSRFPGVRRRFALLDGGGVELAIAERACRLAPGDAAIAFDGEAPVDCRLPGPPARALNLMLRDADGALAPVVPHADRTPPRARCGLYALVAGWCRPAEGTAIAIGADELLWFEAAPAGLRFEPAQPGPPAASPGWWIDVDA